MAPPNNPAVARVAVIGNRDTREWVNTFHVAKPSGSLVAADLTEIANQMETFVNNYRAAWPTVILADLIQVRKLDPSDPLAVDHPLVPPLAGLIPATAAPGNVTLALSERTGLAGRKFRGRFYTPGIADEDIVFDDRITSTLVSLLNSILAQYITQWTSTVFLPVIFHKFSNTYTPVISGVIEAILDSQRRRLPGRGR